MPTRLTAKDVIGMIQKRFNELISRNANMKLKHTFFEKVSPAEYSKERFDGCVGYDEIALPKRQTAGSSGYDFRIPASVTLKPGESVKMPTFVKASIDDGWTMIILPRSSTGFKYYARLANTVGLIDADYYGNPSNEGHIFVKIRNEGDKDMTLNAGDRFCQGVFIPFGTAADDDVSGARTGGMGSTDEQRRKGEGDAE